MMFLDFREVEALSCSSLFNQSFVWFEILTIVPHSGVGLIRKTSLKNTKSSLLSDVQVFLLDQTLP